MQSPDFRAAPRSSGRAEGRGRLQRGKRKWEQSLGGGGDGIPGSSSPPASVSPVQTLSKSTQRCSRSEKNPPVASQILSEISPLNKIPLRLSFTFPFGRRRVAVFTDRNTKREAAFTTDFLSLTLHLSFYGLWVLFLIPAIQRIHLGGNARARAPPGRSRRCPSVWAKGGSFLLHIKIRSKCSPSWWLID